MPSKQTPMLLGAHVSARLPKNRSQKLEQVVARFLSRTPGWAGELFTGTTITWEGSPMGTAHLEYHPQTDTYTYGFDPAFMSKLPLLQALFVLNHEVTHKVREHSRRAIYYHLHGVPVSAKARSTMTDVSDITTGPHGDVLPFHANIWHYACDYWINAFLIACEAGEMPTDCGLNPANVGVDLSVDTEETIYARIYDKAEKIQLALSGGGGDGDSDDGSQGQGQGQGQGNGQGQGQSSQGSFDTLTIKQGAGAGTQPLDSDDMDAIKASMEAKMRTLDAVQKMAGQGSATLEVVLNNLVGSRIDWRKELKKRVMSLSSRGSISTYRRLHTRMSVMLQTPIPGTHGTAAGTVIVAWDTSGSVSQREADVFISETAAALAQVKMTELIILPCDAEIEEVIRIPGTTSVGSDMRSAAQKILAASTGKKTSGGGGTSFCPPFEWVAENIKGRVSQLIYCTDTYGPAPKSAPKYPVTWIVTCKDNLDFCSWGKKIYLSA